MTDIGRWTDNNMKAVYERKQTAIAERIGELNEQAYLKHRADAKAANEEVKRLIRDDDYLKDLTNQCVELRTKYWVPV